MFFKKKPKLSGDEIAERSNQDYDKQLWLKKVLSHEEFYSFILAQETSMVYSRIMNHKEPKRHRSNDTKRKTLSFLKEVKQIIRQHPKVSLSERDRQVEQLIRDADFHDSYQFSSHLYYYFRSFTNPERSAWHNHCQELFEELLGIKD